MRRTCSMPRWRRWPGPTSSPAVARRRPTRRWPGGRAGSGYGTPGTPPHELPRSLLRRLRRLLAIPAALSGGAVRLVGGRGSRPRPGVGLRHRQRAGGRGPGAAFPPGGGDRRERGADPARAGAARRALPGGDGGGLRTGGGLGGPDHSGPGPALVRQGALLRRGGPGARGRRTAGGLVLRTLHRRPRHRRAGARTLPRAARTLVAGRAAAYRGGLWHHRHAVAGVRGAGVPHGGGVGRRADARLSFHLVGTGALPGGDRQRSAGRYRRPPRGALGAGPAPGALAARAAGLPASATPLKRPRRVAAAPPDRKSTR